MPASDGPQHIRCTRVKTCCESPVNVKAGAIPSSNTGDFERVSKYREE
jgi:hypothetical protein